MLPVALFGLTEFSTRFSSALLGTFTVITTYLLVRELFFSFRSTQQKDFETDLQKYSPLSAAFLLAIAPWHLQFSRGAFEGNIAVFFTTTGLYLFLKWVNNNKHIYLITSTIFLIGSLYAYHAARLVVPLIGIILISKYFKKLISSWKITLICAIITALAITPLVVITLRGSLSARAGAVSLINQKYLSSQVIQREITEKSSGNLIISLLYDQRIQYIPLILKGYLDHYSVYHMFIAGDVVDRHHAPDMGLFYLIELPFMIFGLVVLAIKKYSGKFLFWSWWIIAPLPAALASGTPHAIRSILLLPLPQIATSIGLIFAIWFIYNKAKNYKANKLVQKYTVSVFLSTLTLLFTINFTYYIIQYYIHQPVENARSWQYGYKQMITAIKDIYPEFPQVLVTTGNDQPYIFFMFYEKYPLSQGVNPGDFNRYYKNIEFKAIDYLKERQLSDILIVAAGDEAPPGEPIPITEIPYPDGTTAYRIFRRPPQEIE